MSRSITISGLEASVPCLSALLEKGVADPREVFLSEFMRHFSAIHSAAETPPVAAATPTATPAATATAEVQRLLRALPIVSLFLKHYDFDTYYRTQFRSKDEKKGGVTIPISITSRSGQPHPITEAMYMCCVRVFNRFNDNVNIKRASFQAVVALFSRMPSLMAQLTTRSNSHSPNIISAVFADAPTLQVCASWLYDFVRRLSLIASCCVLCIAWCAVDAHALHKI